MSLAKITNFVQDLPTKVARKYCDDPASALLHLGAVGWVLSSLAQTFMIVKNKDIESEKKKFLIPQEITDGVVNLGLYYTITKGIKTFADNLVEKGHIVGEKTRDFIMKHTNNTDSLEEHIKGVSRQFDYNEMTTPKNHNKFMSGFYEGYEKLINNLNFSKIEKKGYQGLLKDSSKYFDTEEKAKILLTEIKSANDEFKKLKSFTNLAATIIGSVLATSIIVPIVRNKVASKQQKKSLERNQTVKPDINDFKNFYRPKTPDAFNSIRI